MTEIERIIKKGIVTEDFLKPEIRNEFYVDEKRKKLWAIILDLLHELDRVCNKLGLKYYACGGTVLGAVRHGGFIPWDDDMDVWMMREDYEELQKHADEFEQPYFLQTPYTDPGYYFSAIKLRNSNTSDVSDVFVYENWNMGIGLDIFPIDAYIESELPYAYSKIGGLACELSTYMRKSNPYLDEKNKKRVANYCGRNPMEIYEEIQSIAKIHFNDPNADCLLEMVYTEYPFKKKIIHTEDVEYQIYLDFENCKIPHFNGYIKHLETMYGDYMKFPPVEERGTWHGGETFDADTPYKETVMRKRNVIK
ncbi:MAG: phosphorylcholine transferase LicD [Candidatus Gastranaerophilaceae bacterium]